ncbi:hypothetical protein CCACVL1_01875 [Corchorus capsularis]|uniref:Hydrophobic seed protein domain-containing protein n=1 Tax=Corchorus capsularis TaxID=210143 RepID=A0A1R3KEI2_COCAP|nr:hypothetical protein CCACVL1_01875 [Corchorus capsularis]
MASSSKASAPIAFFLALNLLFFTLVSSQTPSPPPPPPSPCPGGLLSGFFCLNLLGSALFNITLGTPSPCCSNVLGLLGINAGVCLCPEIARIAQLLGFGTGINITYALGNVLSSCNIPITSGKLCII